VVGKIIEEKVVKLVEKDVQDILLMILTIFFPGFSQARL